MKSDKKKYKDKLIIENRTESELIDLLPYVFSIIAQGKVSKTGKGKQYCLLSTWKNGIRISSDRNECSDRIIIWGNKNA